MPVNNKLDNSIIKNLYDQIKNTDLSDISDKGIRADFENANKRISVEEVEDFLTLINNECEEFFKHTRSLSIPQELKICTSNNPTSTNISGLKVLGELRISEEEVSSWIDPALEKKGAIFKDLTTAIRDNPVNVQEAFNKNKENKDSFFSSFVTSQGRMGLFFQLPDGLDTDGVFVAEVDLNQPGNILPIHIILVMGKSAKANVLLRITSKDHSSGELIAVIQNEFIANENSELNIFQEQVAGSSILLFIKEFIFVGRKASINDFIFDQGSIRTDRFLSADLTGEGGKAIITGLYNPRQGQKYYFDTLQNHRNSYTESDLLFKGVIEEKGYASWKGNIIIENGTRGANGYQVNNNLLLDPGAKVESIPGLEIMADDVRCSHGVTMSNIDKNQMFYLQSRGINKEEVSRLIVDGFFASAVKRIPEKRFEEMILSTIGNLHNEKELLYK